MHTSQLEAYKTIQKSTMSGREIEASVLIKTAHLLKHCQENWDAPDRDTKLDEALRLDQKIWTIFQAELSNPDNPMPGRLKEDLLSLSLFVDKRIFDVMAYPTPEKLTILIEINNNVAAGLRGA